MSIVHASHLISCMMTLVQVHDLIDLLQLHLALLVAGVLIGQLLVLHELGAWLIWSMLLEAERLEALRCGSCEKSVRPPLV